MSVAGLAQDGMWLHDFFFNRRFVQWILIFTFFIGLLAVITRLPTVVANLTFARALGHGLSQEEASRIKSDAPPRWWRVLEAGSIRNREVLTAYLGSVKEQEAAETEWATVFRLMSPNYCL